MKNKFSIIVLTENIDNLKKNLKNSKSAFSSEIEFILIDISVKKESEKIEEFLGKHKNIVYVEACGKSKNEGYNIGLKKATGNYITFIEDSISYRTDTFKFVEKCICSNDAKLVSVKTFYKYENIITAYPMCPEEKKNDLICSPSQLNLAFESYFFHEELLKNICFDTNLSFEDAKLKFLLAVFLKHPFYCFVQEAELYYTNPKENDTTLNLLQYDIQWYNPSLENFVLPFLKDIKKIKGEIPQYIQFALLYYVYAKYNCNINEKDKMILSKEETQKFIENTVNVLQYIENEVILSDSCHIPRWLAYQFILKKNQKNHVKSEIEIKDCIVYMENSNHESYILGNVEEEKANIYAVNYDNEKNSLELDFTVSVQDYLTCQQIRVFIQYAHKRIEARMTECYPLLQCFGITMAKNIPCHVSIEMEKIEKKEKFSIFVEYKEKEYKLQLNFVKIQSRLNESKYSYWNFNKNYLLTQHLDEFIVRKRKLFSGIPREIAYFVDRLIKSKNKNLTIRNFILRFIYWVIHPVMKRKRIWIYYDKIYKGGDNAEYLYQYARKQQDNIKHYYVINKKSNDYKRLKSEKANILIFGTTKQRLYCLYAEAILATHKNVISFCGFGKGSRKHFRDLFNAEIICIQHGLTMQAIAQHQNRLEDNIKLYLCASKYEIKNLSEPIYDYDKDSLKLVGLARFDGLINQDKRQILICPTWRKSAANTKTRMGDTREYTEEFKNSEYFKIFNSVINNKMLIDTARKLNYKILFLLHPVITSQACDFDTNDYVKVLTVQDGISYEQLLTESSLMVTDYSGVQYDFAYMRKPIIYFHPDELPAQYEDGGINYETMGFGPISKNTENLVEMVCEYMKNDCKTKQEYVDRANDFFAFDDYHNCERIYHEIKQYLLKKREE